MKRALVFGEALLDAYPDRRVVAGAPLHVALHLGARGWEARLVTRLGHDADGDRIRRLLVRYGVPLDLVETDPALPTGTVTITFDGDAHGFTIHHPAAWDAIEGPDPLPPHDLLYAGTLAGRADRSRATLERLLTQSTAEHVVLDVNLRPPDVRADVLRLGLRRATLLKVNEAELHAVADALGFAPEPMHYFQQAPRLRHLCVTRGSDGAALYRRDGADWTVPAPDVSVVDTIGAGDAFVAGLADALARGRDEPAALDAARAAAALVLTQQGGLPPSENT